MSDKSMSDAELDALLAMRQSTTVVTQGLQQRIIDESKYLTQRTNLLQEQALLEKVPTGKSILFAKLLTWCSLASRPVSYVAIASICVISIFVLQETNAPSELNTNNQLELAVDDLPWQDYFLLEDEILLSSL